MPARRVSEKVVLDGLKKKEGYLRFLNSFGARFGRLSMYDYEFLCFTVTRAIQRLSGID